jgi:hypothetical protein
VGNSLVVAPVLGRSAAKDQAVGRAASLVFVVSTPRYGFAVFIYTCPLFLHTSAVVNHAGSVPGVQGAAVPAAGAENVGQRFRRIVAAKTDSLVGTQSRLRFCPSSTAPVGTVFPGLRPRALSLRFSVVTGPVGPDPGGRLCPHTAGLCRRPGAWGLPSVVPSKPVIPHALMLQTASGATLHSLCSFRALGGLETLDLEPAARFSGFSTASPALPTRSRDSKPPRPSFYPRLGVGADGSGVPRSGDGV